MNSPEAGAVVPGTNGARKLRWAHPVRGKGKRGGIRVLYFYSQQAKQILLLLGYDKNTPDLTPQQKRDIAARIRAFQREFEEGDHS